MAIIMNYIGQICQSIVCPPKRHYQTYDLGPPIKAQSRRQDFTVLNLNGFKLQASFYQPQRYNNQICVIYLHSMNGSRLESLIYVEEVIRQGLCFCNFDFGGCGNSEGSSISFGANQKNDIAVVVEQLRQRYGIKKVILWGRSMGSASAVKYCQMSQKKRSMTRVIGLILDSCYSSFSQLAIQIGTKKSQAPELIIKAGYFIMKGTLEEKGSFKTKDLQLQDFISTLNVPVIFFTSPDDTIVRSQHSNTLFDLYSHPLKKIVYINGNHNDSRDSDYQKEINEFIVGSIRYDSNKLFYQKYSMEHSKGYAFERNENPHKIESCSCSLIPSCSYQAPEDDFLILTRRTERPSQKLRLKEWTQGNFRPSKSSRRIPMKHLS